MQNTLSNSIMLVMNNLELLFYYFRLYQFLCHIIDLDAKEH